MANEIALLLRIVDEAFDKKSWHGTNLRGSIRGVSADDALRRPGPRRHNIHEIVLHAAYWKYAVRRRLLGEKRGSFPIEGSNWFRRDRPIDRSRWSNDIRLLVEQHTLLRDAIKRVDAKGLLDRFPGSVVSRFTLISGIAAHDLYHAGQIQLIKRLLRG